MIKGQKSEKNDKFKVCPKLKVIHFLLHVLLSNSDSTVCIVFSSVVDDSYQWKQLCFGR